MSGRNEAPGVTPDVPDTVKSKEVDIFRAIVEAKNGDWRLLVLSNANMIVELSRLEEQGI